MAKIIVPFHYAQKVRVQKGDEIRTGYIHEVSHDPVGPSYAITYEENGEYSGGEAWIHHSYVTLLEEVTENSLNFMEMAFEQMREDGDM